MGFQTWLATELRAAGLSVVEESGWRTRSADEDKDASTFNPYGLIAHETQGSATSTDAGEIGVLINGRSDLSGPIAQLYISRAGVVHVVAAGLCHHARTGWAGRLSGYGNTRLIGIEPAHAVSEDWADKPAQYAAYVKTTAVICKHFGWDPERRISGHKEHQPGDKSDPEFSMDRFRADVAAVMEGKTMADLTPHEVVNAIANGSTDTGYITGGPVSFAQQYNLRTLSSGLSNVDSKVTSLTALVGELSAKLDAIAAAGGPSAEQTREAVKAALREGTE